MEAVAPIIFSRTDIAMAGQLAMRIITVITTDVDGIV
jgi:hypothetical protein